MKNEVEGDPRYLAPGTRVGAYCVRGFLGRGTGSFVYEVESELGGRYALKVSQYIPEESESRAWQMDQRFTRNIICLEQLQACRWVARIIAHDRYPDPKHGRQYLVQELVPKPEGLNQPYTITEWAERTSPSLRKLVGVFIQLAEACDEMQEAGIQNRDLKPANILMTPDGEPRLIDFNSAIWERAELITWPSAQCVPTTPAYMPPEMALVRLRENETGCEEPYIWTSAADLHALGVVFYMVLTGRHPFNLNSRSLLTEIAYVRPKRPMELQSVPFGLSKVVMRLLEKDPDERYRNGDELKSDLEALLRVADASWDEPYAVLRTGQEYGDAGGAPHVPGLDSAEVDTAEPREQSPSGPSSLTSVAQWPAAQADPAPEAASASLRRPIASEPAFPSARPMRFLSGRPGERWLLVGTVAALLLAGIGTGLGWWARPASGSSPTEEPTSAPADGALAKGTAVSSPVSQPSTPPVKKTLYRARRAAALAAAATLTGLACPTVRVRPDDDLQWLASCPDDARETVHTLGLYPGAPDDEGPVLVILQKGPNVFPHRAGCEVKEGPLEVDASMSPSTYNGTLVGKIIVGSNRAHFRFTELVLPDGTRYPICGIAAESFVDYGPGVAAGDADDPNRAPASELHPGYLYITTGRLRVRLAPYLPGRSQTTPSVN